jgi:hypothetical protein
MPSSENRRYRRLPVSFPSFVYRQKDSQRALRCEIVNLSLGGALVRCEDPTLAAGEQIIIEIQHGKGYLLKGKVTQVENTEIHLDETDLEGPRVEWANGDTGFVRVAFLELPPKREKTFRHFIESLEQSAESAELTRPRKVSGL